MLIAGAVPIRRLDLSRGLQSCGDWFPNCVLSDRRVLAMLLYFVVEYGDTWSSRYFLGVLSPGRVSIPIGHQIEY